MNYQTNNGNSTADSLSDDIENVSSNIPSYLQEVYHWAYLNERNAKLLDREFIVSAILWGNSKRLRQAVLDEVIAGSYILQVAHVYGTLIPELAKTVGEGGALEVIDIAPLQVSLCKKNLRRFQVRMYILLMHLHGDLEMNSTLLIAFFYCTKSRMILK